MVSITLLLTAALAATPDDLETAVARMAKIGSSSSPSFSPDGRRIAFLSNLSGVPQVWIVPSEGGWPTMVTSLDDPVGGVEWSPDGAWLAISVAPGGGMNQQVYLVRPDGTELRRLTDGGRETNWLGGWSADGARLTFASNRVSPESMDAYLFDLASGAPSLVAKNPGVGYLLDVSPDGNFAVLYRQKTRGDNDLYLVELDSGGETLLTPHEPPAQFGSAAFSPDGRWVYLSTNGGRDRTAFGRVKLAGGIGPIEVLASREDAELQEAVLTEDGGTAALLWNASGRSELSFLDIETKDEIPGPRLPAEIAFEISFSPDGSRIAFTASGAASPPNVWVLERGKGLVQVTDSPHPGIDLESLVEPELVRYPAHDGVVITGWLYRPQGASTPMPLVLSFHGGPEGQERPTFNSTYQALLARGIGVLAPNVRGSSGFGKKFVNLDNGALRVNGVKDIESTVAYVVGAGIADGKRLGVMGGSYGGYMVMAALTEYPETFAAGANLFGVVNFETFFAHTEPWMASISKVEYGDPATEGEMLRKLSPIHKIDRVRTPTLVLHGANDTNVPVVEADQVVENLKTRGVPVEYVLFPDEGHGFRKTPNRIRSTVSIVRWFEKYLKS
ncbi:MAG TPA: S9 family peptidase [Vicinamibacteria bacterium]|nr:S9 family peptidase [Vicinamibacteria bacterium]